MTPEAVALLKNLPTSYDAERGLISCILQDPSLLRSLPVYASLFQFDSHKKILAIIAEMEEDKKQIDVLPVWEKIEKTGICQDLEDFENLFYLSVSPSYASFYHEKLNNIAIAREIILCTGTIQARARDGEEPEKLVSEIAKILEKLSVYADRETEEIRTPQDLMQTVEKLYMEDIPTGVRTGWYSLDQHFKPRPGELTLITGIPGHGKTAFLDALLINLARIHDWHSLLFSAENLPFENHLATLLEIKTGKPFRKGFHERMSLEEMREGMTFLSNYFTFLDPGKPSLDRLLVLAEKSLKKRHSNVLVIDPWNEIEHGWGVHQTETQYISDCLMKIRRFGRKHKLHIFLVAHPMKPKKEADGSYPPPTPYDISGGAHWRNKADNCMTVYRHISKDGEEDPETEIHITKIRFREVGKIGVVKLAYDRLTGRYSSI